MASMNFADPRFYRMKPDPTAVVDNAFSSLASPSIMLGFLDTVGKNDASSLRNAIQATENAGNARERASLDSLSQSERELASQVHQQQQAKYNADSNARMQLLQKYNGIEDKKDELSKSYDYIQSPEKYADRIKSYDDQLNGLTLQLTAATKAVTNNPVYQGETLVNPIERSQSTTTDISSNTQGMIAQATNFIDTEMDKIKTESDLYKMKPSKLYEEFKTQNPNANISQKEFTGILNGKRNEEKEKYENLAAMQKRNIGINTDTQNYEIVKRENQVKKDQAQANLQSIENFKAKMKSLGIEEGSDAWNLGIDNYKSVGAQVALIIAQRFKDSRQPPQLQKIDGLGGLKIVPKK